MEDEDVIRQNANLTALGFISYLESISFDFDRDSIDIIGYGHCGKAIYHLLSLLNIQSRVIRRKTNNLNFISIDEYHKLVKSKYIINTSIENILDTKTILSEYTKYVIDISSNKNIQKDMLDNEIKLIYPGSLPTLYYPYNSALLIFKFIKGNENEK